MYWNVLFGDKGFLLQVLYFLNLKENNKKKKEGKKFSPCLMLIPPSRKEAKPEKHLSPSSSVVVF